MNKEEVKKKSKAVPWGLIVITIALIIIPMIFKIISIQYFNKPSNLQKTGYAYADGAGTIVYFFMGFAMHSLAMWLIIINLIIVAIIWIIYFIKIKREFMKKFLKGLSCQLIINILLHIIRIFIAALIVKYAPEPEYPTSFAKDSFWQILSLFSIIIYNIFSMIIFIIKYIKNKNENALGFSIMSVLAGIYTWLFCGLV